jgi:hypothetical protein
VAEVYSYHSDSDVITTGATKNFLQLLQRHADAAAASQPAGSTASYPQAAKALVGSKVHAAAPLADSAAAVADHPASSSPSTAAANKVNSASSSRLGSSSTVKNSSSLDLQPFVKVAQDVLSYLRFTRSTALLQLLREFAGTGTVSYESVDPDQLQVEVQQLLNLQQLNAWFSHMASKDATERHSRAHSSSTGLQQQQQQMPGRHLLQVHRQQQQQQQQELASTSRRRLHAGDAADLTNALLSQMTGGPPADSTAAVSRTVGGSGSTATAQNAAPPAAAGVQQGSSSSSVKLQSLKDMLCGMKSWSPTGLTGVLPGAVDCAAARTATSAASLATFKPLTVPVVFHCK